MGSNEVENKWLEVRSRKRVDDFSPVLLSIYGITEEMCVEAVMRARGNMRKASQEFGVEYVNFFMKARQSQAVLDAIDICRGMIAEEVEGKLVEQALGDESKGIEPKLQAQIYYLEAQAKREEKARMPTKAEAINADGNKSMKAIVDEYMKNLTNVGENGVTDKQGDK